MFASSAKYRLDGIKTQLAFLHDARAWSVSVVWLKRHFGAPGNSMNV